MHSLPSDLQPDQRPECWDDHVSAYETVFEPFTSQFAETAFERLAVSNKEAVLDVGAGAGGAALALARRGASVTAIDASPRMVKRIRDRAAGEGVRVDAREMDGQTLTFERASFDAAYSIFGVILFPDPVRGLIEMRRVVKPGGMVSLVAWTQPENWQLSAQLRAAALEVWPEMPPLPMPTQLRFREEADFRVLFAAAGFGEVLVQTATACLKAPSARWLARRIEFAPGMAALLARLGERSEAVLEVFAQRLEAGQGDGEISLSGVAFIGSAAA